VGAKKQGSYARNLAKSVGMLALSAAMAIMVTSPIAAVSQGQMAPDDGRSQGSVDLARTLGHNGIFVGAPGVSGAVSTAGWKMVSDLAAGEPPRFVPEVNGGSRAITHAKPWSPLGSNGSGDGAVNSAVQAIAVSGSDLYVAGQFYNVAGLRAAQYIAKWNGSTWSALGSDVNGNGLIGGPVYALAMSGGNLYAGGDFEDAAGIATADYLAKWNGHAWSAVGSDGAGNGALNGAVRAITASGSKLFVGGDFTDAAGLTRADFIAMWNGSTWSALGSDGAGGGAISGAGGVWALAVSGSNLYVGGLFSDVAGIAAADAVARWDGSVWSALGSNGSGDGAISGWVDAINVSGSDVYVGGFFYDAAGIPEADMLAKWDGSVWSALGSNGSGDGALNGEVNAIALSGSDVYVAGDFSDVSGSATADYIARWNGSTWSGLGSNGHGDGALNNYGWALAVGAGGLHVGGYFTDVAGIPSADFIARWALVKYRRPDGLVRLGSGPFVGNNIYDVTGAPQSEAGSAAPGATVSFTVEVENDGTVTDSFKVSATGSAISGYKVKFFAGARDVAAIVAGTYHTRSLVPGAAYLITARVAVKAGAAPGSQVARLVTIISVSDHARKDAVQFIGRRA
jgi:stage V sporulation protein SpoVS